MTSICYLKYFLQERMNEKFTQRICKKSMLQIYKCLSEKNSSFTWRFVEKRVIKDELPTKNLLPSPNAKTDTTETDSLISRGAHIWNTLPGDIKVLTQLR